MQDESKLLSILRSKTAKKIATGACYRNPGLTVLPKQPNTAPLLLFRYSDLVLNFNDTNAKCNATRGRLAQDNRYADADTSATCAGSCHLRGRAGRAGLGGLTHLHYGRKTILRRTFIEDVDHPEAYLRFCRKGCGLPSQEPPIQDVVG